jgi:hypothetical protein
MEEKDGPVIGIKNTQRVEKLLWVGEVSGPKRVKEKTEQHRAGDGSRRGKFRADGKRRVMKDVGGGGRFERNGVERFDKKGGPMKARRR